MPQAYHVHTNNPKLTFGNDLPFTLIAGPCQLESRDHALMMAQALKEITDELRIPFIFKTSFDKANRTNLHSERGIGLDKALSIFDEIKSTIGCPILTDIHEKEQCKNLAEVVDILQIPAFLCRQTDLLVAAAQTGCIINVKKGQFLAPWDIKNVAQKLSDSGNNNVILTDRGTSFGYNTLITDIRGIKIMTDTGYPVVIDATHSIQQPGGLGEASGGQREFAEYIARAALSVGIAGVFMEVHDNPDQAPSDGPCMIKLSTCKSVLSRLQAIDSIIKSWNTK